MKVATFYAECDLPLKPREKSAGFDWHGAIRALERSARTNLVAETILFTDHATTVQRPATRIGDAKSEGVMLWLLDAQAAAVRASSGPLLMVSPDTLIAGRLDMLFGDWDVCLLTRKSPKPIINSVIAVRASAAVADFWDNVARRARGLPSASREWGADIDALVETLEVQPCEAACRETCGIRVRLVPVDGIFETVAPGVRRPPVPIWDFKGSRKAWMPKYATLLGCA